MRLLVFLAAFIFIAQPASAQFADITYSITVTSATVNTNGCTEWDLSPYDMKAFVTSWDNINTTPATTGCMSCSAGSFASCNFTSNVSLQTRTNNAYTISTAMDTWEDDCGDACTFDANSCGTGRKDDCRRQLTQSFKLRETASPSNNVSSAIGPYGTSNSYQWNLAYTWKYAGSANPLTPDCTEQQTVAQSGAIRSWSVQLDANNTYQFKTCGTGEDTYLRLFGTDGHTLVAGNDNNGFACSGNAASLDFTAASTGIYFLELSKAARLPLPANITLYYTKTTCCVNASDCDDNDACTADNCISNQCSNNALCDDDLPCTINQCNNGVCAYPPVVCDDGNICTTEFCNAGTCMYTPLAGCCENNNVFQQHLGAPPCGVFGSVQVQGGKYVTVEVLNGESYTFSTCNASFDTRISGFAQNGALLFSNDNNGSECATNRASIVWAAILTDTIRIMIDSVNCAASATPAILEYKRNSTALFFTSSASVMCPGESRLLAAIPQGGIFSGTGVSGDTFTAPVTGGSYQITYTLGDCFITQTIPVAGCDDGVACTLDACDTGVCSNTPFVCPDDGDACTKNDCANNGTCVVACAHTLPPQMIWQKTYGGSHNDEANALQETPDGGYIIAGATYSNNGDVTGAAGDYDYWLVKTDAEGNLQWQNTFGGVLSEKAYDVLVVGDGYFLAGEASSNDNDVSGNRGDADFWIVKVNLTGNLVAQKSFGGNGKEIAYSIRQTADGGFIVAGKSNSTNTDEDVTGNHGDYDMWVLKLNALGNIMWQKSLGGSGADIAYAVRQTPDGGYIVSGETASSDGDVVGNIGTNIRPWLVKLDAQGNIEWQRLYGFSTANDEHFDIEVVGNDGYILSGSLDYDYWLARLEPNGDIRWEKFWGGSGNDFAYALHIANNGDYLITGKSTSNNGSVSGNKGGNDYWTIRVDDAGNLLWQKTTGGSETDEGYAILDDAKGNIVIAGHTRSGNGDVSNPKGLTDFWVVKLTASGCFDFVATDTAICAGDSLFFGTKYISAPGIYRHSFFAAGGCDSIVELTLSISNNSCISISGKIKTETGVAIPGVAVVLSGDAKDTIVTTADGLYHFVVSAGGSYTITPEKSNDSITNNGITSLDISLIRRHVLGSTFLNSPFKVIAAEATNNGAVTTGDIPLVRVVVLNDKAKFPPNNSRLWEFVNSAHVFPTPAPNTSYNPFPFTKTRTYNNISASQTEQDFIGVKIGDVNGSWNAVQP